MMLASDIVVVLNNEIPNPLADVASFLTTDMLLTDTLLTIAT
jgi:hypothetical protein